MELLAPPVLVLLSPQQALPTPRPVAAHETHREASLSMVLSLLRAAHSELLLSPRCIGSSDRADCADAFFWPVSIDLCIILSSHCGLFVHPSSARLHYRGSMPSLGLLHSASHGSDSS